MESSEVSDSRMHVNAARQQGSASVKVPRQYVRSKGYKSFAPEVH